MNKVLASNILITNQKNVASAKITRLDDATSAHPDFHIDPRTLWKILFNIP